MSTKTETRQPTVREWLAARPFRGYRNRLAPLEWFDVTPTDRQVEVLEQARLRGYLYDPDPEPGDYPRTRRTPIQRGLDTRCWPYREYGPKSFLPFHHEEWEARCAAAGLPWTLRDWQASEVPLHFDIWQGYCACVLNRPSVAAGRFIPEHWNDEFCGTLGVKLHTGYHDGSEFRLEDTDWAALLMLAVGGAHPIHFDYWLYSDCYTIAVQVSAPDAEALAAALTDRLLEVLRPGLDKRDSE
jgi:hypothetical protein